MENFLRHFSNGEQTKFYWRRCFLSEGNFSADLMNLPIILDTAAREKVSEYLNKKKGFYTLYRMAGDFLDGCVDHIFVDKPRGYRSAKRKFFHPGWKIFERRQESELLQNERLKKDISRLQKSAERSAGWSDHVEASKIGAADKGYVGHKSAKMMKRSKTIEKRKQQAIEQKAVLLKNGGDCKCVENESGSVSFRYTGFIFGDGCHV